VELCVFVGDAAVDLEVDVLLVSEGEPETLSACDTDAVRVGVVDRCTEADEDPERLTVKLRVVAAVMVLLKVVGTDCEPVTLRDWETVREEVNTMEMEDDSVRLSS